MIYLQYGDIAIDIDFGGFDERPVASIDPADYIFYVTLLVSK